MGSRTHRRTDRQTGDNATICFQIHSCPLTPSYVLSYPGQMPSVASLFTLQKIHTPSPIPPQIVPSYPHLSPPRGPQQSIVVAWIIYDLVFVEQGWLVVSIRWMCSKKFFFFKLLCKYPGAVTVLLQEFLVFGFCLAAVHVVCIHLCAVCHQYF